jgi:hypothetical protein
VKRIFLASTIILTSFSAFSQRANRVVISANAGPMATIRASLIGAAGSEVYSPLLRLSPMFGASINYKASEKILIGLGWQSVHLDQKIGFGQIAAYNNVTVSISEINYYANMWYSLFCGYKLGKRHTLYAGLSGAELQKTSHSSGMSTQISSGTDTINMKSSTILTDHNLRLPTWRPYLVYTWSFLKLKKSSEFLLRLQYNPIAVYLPVTSSYTNIRINEEETNFHSLASGSVKFASCGIQYNYTLR